MPQQDTSGIKDRIISILRMKGPSLPVRISKEIETSPLFAAAFLSELLSEQRLKLSNMRVGSSPLYLLPGQEYQLEKFSEHLKSREKDAFQLLKEKRFLKDTKQEPAIRVALRSIKDFAIPFKKGEELYWRYFTARESEFREGPSRINELPKEIPKQTPKIEIKKDPLKIFDKTPPEEPKKPPIKKKTNKRKGGSNKANEKFFGKVKDFLIRKSIEIESLEGFSKTDLTLKVRKNDEEHLLVAYNKKRINETDLIKAYKKSLEVRLPYIVLSLGEPLKKISDMIEATKNLSGLEKIE